MIQSLLKLPKIGSRFYFGFSTVINISNDTPSPKLIAAINAVPKDRLLLESDWNEVSCIDTALLEAHRLIADIRVLLFVLQFAFRFVSFLCGGEQGWSLEEAATITCSNATTAIQARTRVATT